MRRSIALVVLALIGLLAPTGAAPDLLFVGPGGTDSSNNCQSSASPCLTIPYALTKATVDPTTITLKAGLHSINNIVPPNNVGLNWIGETPGTAVVDCGNPATPAFAFQVGNSGQATFSVNFTSFRIQNCNKAAIVATQGARVWITDMDFVGNSNAGDSGGALKLAPGLLYLEYSVTVVNSRFTGNSAQFGGAIAAVGYDIGGASRGPANVKISNCQFTSNTAGQWGGAVYIYDPDRQGTVYGGGAALKGCSITGSTFTTNTAGQNGGAVYIVPTNTGAPNQPLSPAPDFANNAFSGNKVTACEAQCGSAFYMNNQPNWQFKNNTFTSNAGTGSLAGAMTVGALLLRNCLPLALDTHTFDSNNATNSATGGTAGVFGAGLGIFLSSDYNLTLTGTNVFSNNRNFGTFGRSPAIGLSGQGRPFGTFYGTSFTGNVAASEGGALYLSPSAQGVTFEGTSFSQNRGTVGGALYLSGGSVLFNNCAFDLNSLTTSTLALGGAVYMVGTQATFNAPSVSGNSGYSGAGVFVDAFVSATVNFIGGSFSTNRALGRGGAIYLGTAAGSQVSGQATVYITDTNFLYNSAGQGGGIYASFSYVLDVSGSQFIGNQADFALAGAATSGGGIFLKGLGNATLAAGAVASIANVYMDLNVAGGTASAGAIRCEGANLSLNATTLQIQPCCSDRCIGCDTVCSQLFVASPGNITCPQRTCPPNVPPPTAAPLPPPGAVITPGPTATPAPDFTPSPPAPPPGTTIFPKDPKSGRILGLKPVVFWVCVVALPALVLVTILVASIVLGMRKPKSATTPKSKSRRSQNYSTQEL